MNAFAPFAPERALAKGGAVSIPCFWIEASLFYSKAFPVPSARDYADQSLQSRGETGCSHPELFD